MILEIHSHTSEHSACSHVSAVDLVRRCFQQDLHGIVITDHHYLWSASELKALLSECALPGHFVILSGQEVRTSDFGDVLIYGADETIPPGSSTADIRRRFPKAALVWAHPYRNGKIPSEKALRDPALHAVEIFNSNQSISENIRGLKDWHRYKFTATGGTDIHSLSYCGTYTTVFDHPIDAIETLAEEIRMGRCRPTLSEIPHAGTSNRQVIELQIGNACHTGSQHKWIVKSHKDHKLWRSGERSHVIMSAISQNGFRQGQFRVPEPVGQDEKNLLLIEEGVQGASLYECLVQRPARSREYLSLAARWLARLHQMGLQITPPNEFLDLEPGRLSRYTSILHHTHNRHRKRIQEIADSVLRYEMAFFADRQEELVQAHGDYHPKNIIIGQDDPAADETRFVAAIDWHSSYQLPAAYDVGTFVAQYENQLRSHPLVLSHAGSGFFVDAYLQAVACPGTDFRARVALFKARTALSIMYYLVKVGMGDSEDLWHVMLSAEQALISVNASQTEWAPDMPGINTLR
ncbi:MAG: hypothetical protein VR64_23255 [Desulfatitalea sp. BRH_c12]|nr:MAG: hypothetical protein VR64_23255 [Desulfatitalea sp. BRH_c12]